MDPATRKHVSKIASELGYVPSRAARNLALGRGDTIGLLLPDYNDISLNEALASDYYSGVAVAASQQALAVHRALAILPRIRSSAELASYALEGAIVLDPVRDDPRLPLLEESGVPCVLVGRNATRPHIPSVAPDTETATTELLEHLRDRGAERVALLATDIEWSATEAALEAYRSWCVGAKQRPLIEVAKLTELTTREAIGKAGMKSALRLLRRARRPDAVIGLFEGFGNAVTAAAHKVGLEVPNDLLVAQDVDGVLAQAVTPSITAIDLNPTELMTEAIDVITNARDDGPLHRTTSTHLRLRASTDR